MLGLLGVWKEKKGIGILFLQLLFERRGTRREKRHNEDEKRSLSHYFCAIFSPFLQKLSQKSYLARKREMKSIFSTQHPEIPKETFSFYAFFAVLLYPCTQQT